MHILSPKIGSLLIHVRRTWSVGLLYSLMLLVTFTCSMASDDSGTSSNNTANTVPTDKNSNSIVEALRVLAAINLLDLSQDTHREVLKQYCTPKGLHLILTVIEGSKTYQNVLGSQSSGVPECNSTTVRFPMSDPPLNKGYYIFVLQNGKWKYDDLFVAKINNQDVNMMFSEVMKQSGQQ